VFASLPLPTVTKSFDVESAGLCDHVDGEITVDTLVSDVVVTDEMPEGLALVDVTVTGGDYDLDWDEDSIEVTLEGTGTYTISFTVQVTDVLSNESVTVINTAEATLLDGSVVTAADDLELLPYYDFEKTFIRAYLDPDNQFGTLVPQHEIPVNTKVYFLMFVDLNENSLSIDMLDAYVKDNLGGNLELVEWYTWGVGTVTERKTGKTEKNHLKWDIGNVPSGTIWIWSDLTVSTDENTGHGNNKKPSGHQEYTDEVDTTHELNSGATLKFTASDTGFTCSVSTPPVTITTDAD
jgi:hypothetical protein